ncbi:lipoprotein [Allofrancisella guangzhouensis]|nr:lipoprotein [Allofrancisella guangzhouensis]MBK2027512.1 lipoprotein [Allofrancisella guangzhouensis]MBK2044379.1 lipoprotein [Allofrancisella guangzhouensis]MBK2045435.1 lipoprotein [Allofrancisella guangzhouensis]
MKKLFLLIFLSYSLTGCGQTGPLYLPEDQQKDNETTKISSGSTIATDQNDVSSSSTNTQKTVSKVDDDPTPPSRNTNVPTSELADSGDNFNYDVNIQDSSEAGGTP